MSQTDLILVWRDKSRNVSHMSGTMTRDVHGYSCKFDNVSTWLTVNECPTVGLNEGLFRTVWPVSRHLVECRLTEWKIPEWHFAECILAEFNLVEYKLAEFVFM